MSLSCMESIEIAAIDVEEINVNRKILYANGWKLKKDVLMKRNKRKIFKDEYKTKRLYKYR